MTRFFRLSGSGNDFLALAEPEENPSPLQIEAWCRRGVSAGADGLFLLRRSAPLQEQAEQAGEAKDAPAVTMDHFNADGGAAELCVNGTRCAARLAFYLGWARDRVRIRTAGGTFEARALAGPSRDPGEISRVLLEVPPPAESPHRLEVEAGGDSHAGWAVTVGVPHFVLPWPEGLSRAPVGELGPLLRSHEVFGKAGANIDFVRFPEPGRLEIRTYERGVEAETLACGSGVLAAALAGLTLGSSRLPVDALTAGGFELRIEGEPAEGLPTRWSLEGDARLVAEGFLHPGAGARPAVPRWS